MSRFRDLTGQRFGILTAIRRSENKKSWTMWVCRCDCGHEIAAYSTHLVRGNTQSCGCQRTSAGAEHVQWQGCGEISGHRWSQIRRRGLSTRKSRQNHQFAISIDYAWSLFLEQNGRCALSGMRIEFGKTNNDETTASLDRIDSSIGYVRGNVQWVHKDVNRMKNIFSQSRFIEVCKRVAHTHG